MAQTSVLARKQRFQARSDREREKLQATISTYVTRHHAAEERQQLEISSARLEEGAPVEPEFQQMESWIEQTIAMVTEVMAAR